jgi:copper chaperone CopZ
LYPPHFTALAGGRDDDMEEVALLGPYGGAAGEVEAGVRRVQVRVTGMTCSACTGAVEAAVSARRGVRTVAVSLLQNRARVAFDPALAKVCCSRDPSFSLPRHRAAKQMQRPGIAPLQRESALCLRNRVDFGAVLLNWGPRGGKLSCVLSVWVVRTRNGHS